MVYIDDFGWRCDFEPVVRSSTLIAEAWEVNGEIQRPPLVGRSGAEVGPVRTVHIRIGLRVMADLLLDRTGDPECWFAQPAWVGVWVSTLPSFNQGPNHGGHHQGGSDANVGPGIPS